MPTQFEKYNPSEKLVKLKPNKKKYQTSREEKEGGQ